MSDVGLQSDIWATDTKVSAQRIVESEFMLADVWVGEKANFVYVDGRANDSVYLRSIKLIQSLEGQKTYARKTDTFAIATKIYVFVSKSGTYLDKLFDKTQPAKNELVLYIEDNEGDLVSNAYAHIKMGSSLGRNGRQYALASHDEFKEVASHLKEEYNFKITPEEIDILTTGEVGLKNILITSVDFLYQLTNLPQIALSRVFRRIGNELLKGTGVLRDVLQFKDKDWDPAAKRDKKDGEFKPVLLSSQDKKLDDLGVLLEKARKNVKSRAALLREKLNGLANKATLSDKVPDGFVDVMHYVVKAVDKIEKAVHNEFTFIVVLIKELGKEALSAINAFYCGLWNSMVDVVLGLVDLIGFLFTLLAAQGEFTKDFSGNMARIMELVDEAIQAVVNFDYALFLKRIDAKFKNFNFSSILNEVSKERSSYAMGAMIGFIVEILIDSFATKGVSALKSIRRKLGSWGDKIATTVEQELGKVLGKTGKRAGLALLNTIEQIISFINSGAEKVAEMLEVILQAIGLLANVTDEAVKGVLRGLDLGFDQIKEIFSKKRYKIVDAADGKLAFKEICS